MESKKPSKTRKYLAKGRPDFAKMEFEHTASVEQDVQEWSDNWISDMKIKHGREFNGHDVFSTTYVEEGLKGKEVIVELLLLKGHDHDRCIS